MRVAIIHEWLVNYAGSERVVEQILDCYPDADIFSIVDFLPEGQRDFIHNKRVTTSFIQKLPFARTQYRNYLPLMPLAVEQFDLSQYDLVISSNHAVAKGVLTGPDQLHVCYVHSPIRYAWDLQHQYLRESNLLHGIKAWLAKWVLHKVRLWDTRTANGVDHFLANSAFIGRRIMKTYRRDSTVLYPPVDVRSFEMQESKEDFYLTASRMVPYKKIDVIVEAFNAMPDKKLVVIGEGPDFEKIKAKAGPNVSLLGFQSFEVLKNHMQRAKAFVFAAEEDFGITPVEAQACGTPVIAFGKGGALETIRPLGSAHPTGLFFEDQSVQSIVAAVAEFESSGSAISPTDCKNNADQFGQIRFKNEFKFFVEQAYADFFEMKSVTMALPSSQ
jgi:glycosyltransferase involved in cell wall biosynthesis